MKRAFSALLCALLLYALLPAAAETAEQETEPEILIEGDYQYVLLEDGTAEIRGLMWYVRIENLIIPDKLGGTCVTAIGDEAFRERSWLTSVTIPDSVTTIGVNPFIFCGNLATVNISPDHPALATIDGVLFSKKDKRLVWYPITNHAKEYAIPQGIEIIGDGAFFVCDLASVTIPNSVVAIGNQAFSSSGLTSVTLPDSVTTIGNQAFYGSRLTSVTLPDSVTTIGDQAFSSCYSLTSVTLPDSVTTIGVNPFDYCPNLATVNVSPDHPALATIDGVLFSKKDKRLVWYPMTSSAKEYAIPQGIEIIGDCAFSHCFHRASVTIPDSVTAIGNQAFYGSELTSVTIPDNVTEIGDSAFSYCRSLTSVTIPNNITEIGDGAFSYCISLISVTIPGSVTTIADKAFSNCGSLTSVTIPGGVTTIGNQAFRECSSLASVTIPDSVTTIGYYAFRDCSNLSSIIIPDSITSISYGAFFGCPNITLTVPRNSYAAQYCKDNGLTYIYPDSLDWLNQ